MKLNYKDSSSDVSETLYSAQLLADAFTKTIEENNCLSMLPITLHQNIVNSIDDVVNLVDLQNDVDPTKKPTSGGNTGKTSAAQVLDSITQATQQHKNSCFNCKLSLPKVKFSIDLNSALNKLKADLALYKGSLTKLDMCQTGYAMQSSCLPDILKLIVVLITAYLSIMALKKISGLTMSAFLKGVISKLFSLLIGSFKISIDIGATNIACLINALKEVALAIPNEENIKARLNDEQIQSLGLVPSDNGMTTRVNKGLDNVSNGVDSTLKAVENSINSAFSTITNTVDSALKSIEDYIKSLLSLKGFLSGEDIRLGLDITEIYKYINNLIQTLNLLSAIAMSLAKRSVRESMCKTAGVVSQLSDKDIKDYYFRDLVQDYNRKVTDISKSDDSVIGLLIHDKPVTDGLPKIDMFDCSIDDFIEAHSLPNIIQTAKDQVDREGLRPRYNVSGVNDGSVYTLVKPDEETEDLLKNIADLLYIKPTDKGTDLTTSKEEGTIWEDIINPMNSTDAVSESIKDLLNTSGSNENTLKCKSIEDVLDVLNNIKR